MNVCARNSNINDVNAAGYSEVSKILNENLRASRFFEEEKKRSPCMIDRNINK